MTYRLLTEPHGTILLERDLLATPSLLLPEPEIYRLHETWGDLHLEQAGTARHRLWHLQFSLCGDLAFSLPAATGGLYSLTCTAGSIAFRAAGHGALTLRERDTVLFTAGPEPPSICLPRQSGGALLLVHHPPADGRELSFLSSLPAAGGAARLVPAALSRSGADGLFREDRLGRYPPSLRAAYADHLLNGLRLLALTELCSPARREPAGCRAAEKAAAARDLLGSDYRKKWTVATTAAALGCSPAWLKKAFSGPYGEGLYHYLRSCRMERAEVLLQAGESLKAAAIAVGMKPGTFPKEFKAYFGYTVTEMKRLSEQQGAK